MRQQKRLEKPPEVPVDRRPVVLALAAGGAAVPESLASMVWM